MWSYATLLMAFLGSIKYSLNLLYSNSFTLQLNCLAWYSHKEYTNELLTFINIIDMNQFVNRFEK
jgi:hypothetical protein